MNLQNLGMPNAAALLPDIIYKLQAAFRSPPPDKSSMCTIHMHYSKTDSPRMAQSRVKTDEAKTAKGGVIEISG